MWKDHGIISKENSLVVFHPQEPIQEEIIVWTKQKVREFKIVDQARWEQSPKSFSHHEYRFFCPLKQKEGGCYIE